MTYYRPMHEVWTDPLNNVWISANVDKTVYEIRHRHTGGVFPRLFPLEAAPDKATALSAKEAAKWAAKMVRAYRAARGQ